MAGARGMRRPYPARSVNSRLSSTSSAHSHCPSLNSGGIQTSAATEPYFKRTAGTPQHAVGCIVGLARNIHEIQQIRLLTELQIAESDAALLGQPVGLIRDGFAHRPFLDGGVGVRDGRVAAPGSRMECHRGAGRRVPAFRPSTKRMLCVPQPSLSTTPWSLAGTRHQGRRHRRRQSVATSTRRPYPHRNNPVGVRRSTTGGHATQCAKPQSSIFVASSKRLLLSLPLRIAPTRVRLSRLAAKTRA